MKKLFLLMVVFAFVGVTNAQEKQKSNEASAGKVEKKNNMDEWSQELNLSETQRADITKIEDDFKTRKQAIRSTGTAEDFKKLNDEKKAAIDAVLTPEQKVKKEQMREKKVAEKQQKAEMQSIQK